MLNIPFYDPEKTYEENFNEGPFGDFGNNQIFKNQEEPQYDFLGEKVYLPFGIAAGPLLNGKYVKSALDKGFDIAVYKTVRTKKYPCNPWPNVIPLKVNSNLTLKMQDAGIIAKKTFTQPLTITNSFGVPSFDPDFWQKDMSEAVKHAKRGQVVIGSFQGTVSKNGNTQAYINDFANAARLVKETGAKILEANLSCPNEGTAHLLCFDLERTKQIVEKIKNEIKNTPLIIKIAYFRDEKVLEKLIKNVGNLIQGVAAINTMPAKIYDKNKNQALPGENRLVSGTCGSGIKWAGLEMTKRIKKIRENLQMSFKIIGVGGVIKKEDYQEYISSGADAVMSVTGAMWNPYLAQEIKKSL